MRLTTTIMALLAASTLWGQATLTLTGPATARPGQTVTASLALANPPASLAATQWAITLPPGITATAVAGAASAAAAKTLYCNSASTLCFTVGINSNIYAAGSVASYSIFVPLTAVPGVVTIPLSGLVGATLVGDATPLTAGAAYSLRVLDRDDVNGDGIVNEVDLQLVIQSILTGKGLSVIDAQRIARLLAELVGALVDPRNITDWRKVEPLADSVGVDWTIPLASVRLAPGLLADWRHRAAGPAVTHGSVQFAPGQDAPILVLGIGGPPLEAEPFRTESPKHPWFTRK